MNLNNLKKHKFIVFGCEHYNPLGMIRSLGEEGIRPIAILLKGELKIASKSKYISRLHFVASYEEGYELLLKLYTGNLEYKPFILTGDDALQSLLDARYDKLKEHFIMFNAGKQNRILHYMDKENICNLAIKHEVAVLPTIVMRRGEIPEDIDYPIITKAINSLRSTWKDDVFICQNEVELREAYKQIKSTRVLLQKYIIKKNELCLEGCSVNKGADVFFSMESRYNYILPDTYSPYMTIKNCKESSLIDKCKNMLAEIGFEGIFSIEFLISPQDELYFLEINMRNSTWSYASTKAGMNLPVIWANGMLEKKLNGIDLYRDIPDGYTAMVEFSDFSNRVTNGRTSLYAWLKEYWRACHFVSNKKDIAPLISCLLPRLRHKAKMLFRFGDKQ